MIQTSLLNRHVRIEDGVCGIIRGVLEGKYAKSRYIIELPSGRLSEYYAEQFTMDVKAEEPIPVELGGERW